MRGFDQLLLGWIGTHLVEIMENERHRFSILNVVAPNTSAFNELSIAKQFRNALCGSEG